MSVNKSEINKGNSMKRPGAEEELKKEISSLKKLIQSSGSQMHKHLKNISNVTMKIKSNYDPKVGSDSFVFKQTAKDPHTLAPSKIPTALQAITQKKDTTKVSNKDLKFLLGSNVEVKFEKPHLKEDITTQDMFSDLYSKPKKQPVFDIELEKGKIYYIKDKLSKWPMALDLKTIKIMGTTINSSLDINSVYLISEWLMKKNKEYFGLNHRKRSVGIYGEFIYRNQIYGNVFGRLKYLPLKICLDILNNKIQGNEGLILEFFVYLKIKLDPFAKSRIDRILGISPYKLNKGVEDKDKVKELTEYVSNHLHKFEESYIIFIIFAGYILTDIKEEEKENCNIRLIQNDWMSILSNERSIKFFKPDLASIPFCALLLIISFSYFNDFKIQSYQEPGISYFKIAASYILPKLIKEYKQGGSPRSR